MYRPRRSTMYQRRHSTGSTIIAATCDGAIILGADARVTSEMEVHSNKMENIIEIDDNVFICINGRVDDCELAIEIVRQILDIRPISVALAGTVVSTFISEFQDRAKRTLKGEFIVAGWNKNHGGEIYYLPINMPNKKQKCVLGGSGSIYLTGLFDHVWNERMDVEECKKFVIDAISIALFRDFGTVGCVNLVTINSKGATRSLHPCTTRRFPALLEPMDSLLYAFPEENLKSVASMPLPDIDEERLNSIADEIAHAATIPLPDIDEEWLNS